MTKQQAAKAKEEEEKEVVEVDAEALKAISEQVAESLDLDTKIQKASEDAANAAAEAVATKMETSTKKTTATDEEKEQGGEDPESKSKAQQYGEDSRLAGIAKESKEQRLFKSVKALVNNDFQTLDSYKQFSLDQRTKAGYGSTDTDADGGYLVPDPEFDTTIYENLPNYGVAFQYADVRQTDRTAVKLLTLDSGLEFYETAEAGVKQSGKLQFSRQTVDLKKYAVIVPAVDELDEDSAVDYWNLVTTELSRAYAKKADEVTFTHSTSGITNTTGVIIEPVDSGATSIDWDDILNAEGAIEDSLDSSNFRWYMRRELWFHLAQKKDSNGKYQFTPNPNQPATPWGTPVVFTRVLPKTSETGSNDAMAVFGDLKNYILYNKRGMAMKVLTEATVKDTDDADFNLATQDGTALRAVVRMLGSLPKGNAGKFVVLGTGTVS